MIPDTCAVRFVASAVTGLVPRVMVPVRVWLSLKLIIHVTFNNLMLRTIQQLVCIILTFYCRKVYEDNKLQIDNYLNRIMSLTNERGISFTVKFVKLSRLAVTRYITGHPLEILDGVALKSGFPIWILDLKHLTETESGLKVLMTLLVSLRSIHLDPVLDVSPISDKWKGFSSISEREHRHACKRLRIRSRELKWKSFHMSTKKGPLGQALLTSVSEMTLLPLELIADIKLLGGDKLTRCIDNLMMPRWDSLSVADIWKAIFPPKTSNLRKLSYFSDKEGKTRVIAILDYWSQSCLRPLHFALMDILRGVKQDCTFDQNKFSSVLPSHGPYYSLDLSNATDRMPLLVQKRVIAEIIGLEKAEAWARVLTKYAYTAKGLPVPVLYGAGQPMGAYSSWGAMAVTHHYLVHISALRCGKPHFKDYCLLGDDIVIANADVAQQYKILLSELDMPISEQKTHVSNDTYEFAKRWIHKGSEVTGFAIAGLGSVWERYSLLHNFLDTQRLHGWSLDIDKHPDLITALYTLYGKPAQAERVIKLYNVFDSVAKAINTGDYEQLLIRTALVLGIEVPSIDPGFQDLNHMARAMMVKVKKRLVERDLERFQKDAYSVSAKLTGTFLAKFPSLSVQDYRAVLRGNHPLVSVLNDMIIASVRVLTDKYGMSVGITTARSSQYQAIGGTLESEVSPDTYLEKAGISKYFVSKGVFSMRASTSINLAQSQVTKEYMTLVKSYRPGSLLLDNPQ